MSDGDTEGTVSMIDGETGLRMFECPECGEVSPIVGIAVGPGGKNGEEQPFPVLGCGSVVQVATVEAVEVEEQRD